MFHGSCNDFKFVHLIKIKFKNIVRRVFQKLTAGRPVGRQTGRLAGRQTCFACNYRSTCFSDGIPWSDSGNAWKRKTSQRLLEVSLAMARTMAKFAPTVLLCVKIHSVQQDHEWGGYSLDRQGISLGRPEQRNCPWGAFCWGYLSYKHFLRDQTAGGPKPFFRQNRWKIKLFVC